MASLSLAAIFEQALNLHRQGQLAAAAQLYQQILQQNPKDLNALQLLGTVYLQSHQYDLAKSYIKHAIAISPTTPFLHYNLGLVYLETNQFAEAIEKLKYTIELEQNYLDAYSAWASILVKQADYAAALEIVNLALAKDPQHIKSLEILGTIYEHTQNNTKAFQIYQQLLTLCPQNILALNNISNLLINQGEFNSAQQNLTTVLKLSPQHADSLNNLGNLNLILNNLDCALEYFTQAIAANPKLLVAKLNMAVTLRAQDKYVAAKNVYQQIIDNYNTYNKDQTTNMILAKSIIGLGLCYASTCNWEALENLMPQILATLEVNKDNNLTILKPYEAIILKLDSARYRQITEQQVTELRSNLNTTASEQSISQQAPTQRRPADNKITIGYLSPDFGKHPVGLLINNLFTWHNRDKFTIKAFSLKKRQDTIAETIHNSVDDFLDIDKMGDQEIINCIRQQQVDILVDLCGHTKLSRPQILMAKPAPIQAHWLGYINSQWIQEIDYYITTESQVPSNMQYQFMERLAYLPDSLIACDLSQAEFKMPNSTLNYQDFGLPADKFIFCSFNQSRRISGKIFDVWLDILGEVPNSILWLSYNNDATIDNLLQRCVKQNIDPQRLYFRKPGILNDTWHHQLADLYLDTPDESGGTTTILSLIAKLPVLTMTNNTPQSRMSAALLTAMQLDELVTDSLLDYKQLAISIAHSTTKQQTLNNTIKQNINSSTLFDPAKFVQHLESVYLNMLTEGNNID